MNIRSYIGRNSTTWYNNVIAPCFNFRKIQYRSGARTRPKANLSLCLFLSLASNAVKVEVMSRLKLGSGCCAVGCNVSYTLIYLWRIATISKLTITNRFSKRLWLHWINMSTAPFQNMAWVFLYHCISEGNRLSLEHCRCHFHVILPVIPDKSAFMSSVLLCVQPLPGKPLFLTLQKHLLLAENELAFSSPSHLRSKHILHVIKNNLL